MRPRHTNRIVLLAILALFMLADISSCKLLTPDIVYKYEETQGISVPWDDTSDDDLWGQQGVRTSSHRVYWNRDFYCSGFGCPTGRYFEVIIEEQFVDTIEDLGFKKG